MGNKLLIRTKTDKEFKDVQIKAFSEGFIWRGGETTAIKYPKVYCIVLNYRLHRITYHKSNERLAKCSTIVSTSWYLSPLHNTIKVAL